MLASVVRLALEATQVRVCVRVCVSACVTVSGVGVRPLPRNTSDYQEKDLLQIAESETMKVLMTW